MFTCLSRPILTNQSASLYFLSYTSSICLVPGLLMLSLVILDLSLVILSLLHSNVSKNSYARSKSQVLLLKKKKSWNVTFYSFAWNFDTGKSIHTTSKYGVNHRACFLNCLTGNSKPQADSWLEFYSGTRKFRFRSYVPFNIIWLQLTGNILSNGRQKFLFSTKKIKISVHI